MTLHHTTNIRLTLVQLDLQGYNPRNGQGLLKVGYKGLSNYSNLSTVGFELQTSCMVVWQPNYYTKITKSYKYFYILIKAIFY